ncbi:MAG: hypothetical protein LBN93_09700 [Candidatus Symbiothrix sp.]|jgi:hypothetical protein|nr:hypothetical protein [Candidatus Symbiothrix sp.]
MEKEFGKWCLDIAKYVLTAGILATVFGNLGGGTEMYFIGGLIFISFAVAGFVLLKDSEKSTEKLKEKKKTKKERRKIWKD